MEKLSASLNSRKSVEGFGEILKDGWREAFPQRSGRQSARFQWGELEIYVGRPQFKVGQRAMISCLDLHKKRIDLVPQLEKLRSENMERMIGGGRNPDFVCDLVCDFEFLYWEALQSGEEPWKALANYQFGCIGVRSAVVVQLEGNQKDNSEDVKIVGIMKDDFGVQ
jgi:hypothetical protein